MLRSTFIEDLSTLDYFPATSCCTAKQRDTNKYYLLSDRLALEIDAELLNSKGEFIDPACADSYKRALAQLYNPFRPYLYKKHRCVFKFQSSHISDFDIYQHPNQNVYVIHKQYPWIGMNISARFELSGDSMVIGFKNNHDETLFHEAWQQAQRESHVPESLRKIILDKFKEQNDAEEARQLQYNKSYYSNMIISYTLYSEELVKLKSYVDHLRGLNDMIAVSKALQFKPFLDALHSGMEFDALATWLVKLDNFASTFKGYFTPRPGLFAADTPEETKSYILFAALRQKVNLTLIDYNFWQRFAINPHSDNCNDTTLKRNKT